MLTLAMRDVLEWTSNKVYYYLQYSREASETLTDRCYDRKIDTGSLATILDQPQFRRISTDATQIESIQKSGKNSIRIQFTTPSISNTTSVQSTAIPTYGQCYHKARIYTKPTQPNTIHHTTHPMSVWLGFTI